MPLVKLGERPKQSVEILVGMQCGDRENESLRRALGRDIEEDGRYAMRHDAYPASGQSVVALKVRCRRVRHGHDVPRYARAPVQKEIPERQVEPAEILWMPLMLQVMKYGDLRRCAENRRGEAGIEQHVDPPALRRDGQDSLLI